MSDETPDKNAPGLTTDEDASTAKIPYLPKPNQTAAAEPSVDATVKTINNTVTGDQGVHAASSDADAKTEESKPADFSTDEAAADPEVTKASMTERIAAAVPAPLRNPKPVVRSTPDSTKVDGVTPVSRPVTAGEYARTSSSSSSTTAVIPALRDDQPESSPAVAAATAASGRQASLKLVRVDPWSVTKVTFALTVALMIVAVVAVTILWIVLSFAGVWDQINSSVTTVLSDNSSSFDITQYLGFGRIVGLTLVISAINVVITTAVATIGAYLYNLAAQLLGGVDITLAEDD